MAVVTQSHLLIHPPQGADYSVKHVDIPITDLEGAPDNHSAGSRWKIEGVHDLETLPHPSMLRAMPATVFTPSNANGAWLLIICGAGDNRFAFKWLLTRALLQQGLSLLTIDPPGHGDFMSAPATVHNVRRAASVAADWLHARVRGGRIGALGISFGACQASWLAASDNRIATLTTISAPVKLRPVTRSIVAREALALALPRNALLLRQASWPQIWAEWKTMRGAWFGESLYDMIDAFDMPGAVRAIGTRPTLFVHGGADAAVPPQNSRTLYDAALPERELIIVPQASHLTVVLQKPEMTQVASWLSQHLT